jgi:hypothetical protein
MMSFPEKIDRGIAAERLSPGRAATLGATGDGKSLKRWRIRYRRSFVKRLLSR